MTTCSPDRGASTFALEPATAVRTPAASWASLERGSAGESTSRPVRRAAPLRGWIFLEWGPEIAVERLSPVERMARLAQAACDRRPVGGPRRRCSTSQRAPAFVWYRPKGWRSIEPQSLGFSLRSPTSRRQAAPDDTARPGAWGQSTSEGVLIGTGRRNASAAQGRAQLARDRRRGSRARRSSGRTT